MSSQVKSTRKTRNSEPVEKNPAESIEKKSVRKTLDDAQTFGKKDDGDVIDPEVVESKKSKESRLQEKNEKKQAKKERDTKKNRIGGDSIECVFGSEPKLNEISEPKKEKEIKQSESELKPATEKEAEGSKVSKTSPKKEKGKPSKAQKSSTINDIVDGKKGTSRRAAKERVDIKP